MSIDNRKNDHIDICLEKAVRTTRDHWDDVHLVHQAVPSSDLDEVDLGISFLEKKLAAPLIISAMTGGSRKALEYNRMLARAASEFQIGFGVGSQRSGLERSEFRESYSLVKEYDIPLVLANLGAPQFSRRPGGQDPQYSIEEALKAIDMVNGDAICIHLNYLQEVVQPEGETNASGLIDNLSRISTEVKVIAKETGAGISRDAALLLKEAGVAGIDVGGASGTSFAAVESYREGGGDGPGRASRMGRTYWDWGIPTPASVKLARVGLPLIATGGLRNGQDVVKAISVGADIGGMAWPLLVAASRGYRELEIEIAHIMDEIRAGLFLTGCRSVSGVSKPKHVITGWTREYIDSIALL
ncbi:MAG: type 2 isopentenyl-diphosphate Delta-isomerase [Thermoplasmatota archaeon]